jgi:hypothetical protein
MKTTVVSLTAHNGDRQGESAARAPSRLFQLPKMNYGPYSGTGGEGNATVPIQRRIRVRFRTGRMGARPGRYDQVSRSERGGSSLSTPIADGQMAKGD